MTSLLSCAAILSSPRRCGLLPSLDNFCQRRPHFDNPLVYGGGADSRDCGEFALRPLLHQSVNDLLVSTVPAGDKPLKVYAENGGGFRIVFDGGHGVDVVSFFPTLALDRPHTGGGVLLVAVANGGDAGSCRPENDAC